jgi:hypothetical protein
VREEKQERDEALPMASRSFGLIAQDAGLISLHQFVLVIVGEGRGRGYSPQCLNGGGAKTSGRVSDPSIVTRRTVSMPHHGSAPLRGCMNASQRNRWAGGTYAVDVTQRG